jgi:S-adenosylmethionine:tRNA ribosyltransferase-isomerase
MHSEYYEVTQETANLLNATRSSGGRIICVGTTSVRTLETATDDIGIIHSGSGETDIFIYPGYKFKACDALITNFHLPKSTLLMLVSALSSREEILEIYNIAVKEKYRFFSFGDAMFIK